MLMWQVLNTDACSIATVALSFSALENQSLVKKKKKEKQTT